MKMNCMKKNNHIKKAVLAVVTIVLLSIAAAPPKPQTGPVIVQITTKFGVMKVKLYDETPLHRDNFLKLVKSGFYDSLTFHKVIYGMLAQGGDAKSKYATVDSVIGDADLGYRVPAEIRGNLIHKYGAIAAVRDNNPDMASNASQFFLIQGRRFTLDELTKIEGFKNQRIKSDMLYLITQADSTKRRMEDFTLRGDRDGLKKFVASFQPVVDSLFKQRGEFKFTNQQIQEYTSIGGVPQLDSGYTVFGEVISGFNIIDSICTQKTARNERPLEDIRMKIRVVKK
jgi:cyclophilin family peptidyl-prolyl cis-trans isomerase